MMTKTHNIFNIGVLTYIGAFFTVPLYSLISAVLISFPLNTIIDKYGHENKEIEIKKKFGPFSFKKKLIKPVRTYLTHSPATAFIIGLIPALVLFFGALYFRSYLALLFVPYFILIQGLLAGELHLLLDLPTEGGIFINKKRFALGHFAYNNPLLNSLGVILGLCLIYISFGGNYEEVYYVFKHIVFIFKHTL